SIHLVDGIHSDEYRHNTSLDASNSGVPRRWTTPVRGSADGRPGALLEGEVRRRGHRRACVVDRFTRAKSPREKPLLSRHRSWGTRMSSPGPVVPFRAHRRPVLADIARRRDDEEPRAGAAPARAGLLQEEELRAIEGAHPDGITAVQIVDAFTSR